MNNIKKIYQHAGNCDDHQNLKDILDAAMVSTPEEVIDESPNVPMTSSPVNNSSAKKSLFLFNNIFNVEKKTAKLCFGTAKSKHRSMKVSNILWTNKKSKRTLKNL